MTIEYTNARGRRNNPDVMIRGIANATTLTEDQVERLLAAGNHDVIFNTYTGRIRDHLKRPMTVAEARKRLAQRHSDGSPRRKCGACGEPLTDDYKCPWCNRRRRPDEPPRGGWPPITAEQIRRTTETR
ncbi:MAG: hypothetical protein ACLP3C_29685 [Mycobacterium sp.]|uniref:hypothetical protein n=1 Tax=Mycobacterium sp. TaxID=1785 RepID=UPI003F97F4B4